MVVKHLKKSASGKKAADDLRAEKKRRNQQYYCRTKSNKIDDNQKINIYVRNEWINKSAC
jgi:hypothetical protein